jgi:hypothetical protein
MFPDRNVHCVFIGIIDNGGKFAAQSVEKPELRTAAKPQYPGDMASGPFVESDSAICSQRLVMEDARDAH